MAHSGSPSPVSKSSSSSSFASKTERSEWCHRIYAATTPGEGIRVFFDVVPYWVPLLGLAGAAGAYYITFRVRLFMSQWRIAERRRAERKFELLDSLRGTATVSVGAVHRLGDDDDDVDDDDDDDDDEEDRDYTAVSRRDINEFRSSMGIRLPRDDDLLAIVERMLMSDPIPDGWVLYRTSAGIIRFMNLNTQELFFFPPNRRKEKLHIESELRKRNREAMESRYNFSYDDEGLNSNTLSPSRPDVASLSSGRTSRPTVGGPSPIDFSDEGAGQDDDDDETHGSAFHRLFHYFLEREQRRIEQDVVRSRTSREGSALNGAKAPSPGGWGASAAAGVGSGTSSGGGIDGLGSSYRQSSSMTDRVVPSSMIHVYAEAVEHKKRFRFKGSADAN